MKPREFFVHFWEQLARLYGARSLRESREDTKEYKRLEFARYVARQIGRDRSKWSPQEFREFYLKELEHYRRARDKEGRGGIYKLTVQLITQALEMSDEYL